MNTITPKILREINLKVRARRIQPVHLQAMCDLINEFFVEENLEEFKARVRAKLVVLNEESQAAQASRKLILTCDCGKRYFVAGELLVPIKDSANA